MNIDHCIYFIETVKLKSFTKAAESLFISQSTVSKAIKLLEKEYDAEFVDRSAKKFKLTSAGEIFYHSAVKIVSYYKTETDVLSVLLHSNRGTLVLSIPPVIITVIYSLLAEYKIRYPGIHLRISEVGAKNAYAMIKAGVVDVSILIQPFDDEEFAQIPFLYSEIVCVVSEQHWLVGRNSVSFKHLAQETFYIFDDTFMLHDSIIQRCKEAGFLPSIAEKSAQWDVLIEAVRNGNGITLLPKPIIDKFEMNKVVCLPIEEPFYWIPTAVYHKEKIISRPMQLFLDMIRNMKKTDAVKEP